MYPAVSFVVSQFLESVFIMLYPNRPKRLLKDIPFSARASSLGTRLSHELNLTYQLGESSSGKGGLRRVSTDSPSQCRACDLMF